MWTQTYRKILGSIKVRIRNKGGGDTVVLCVGCDIQRGDLV